MAVTINTGQIATDDPLAADLQVSMASKVAYLDTDTTQFTTLLMKLPVETARSFKEEWEENVFLPKNTALSASATSAATTLSITTNEGSYARDGDIGKFVESGEAFRITTASASSWTVVRAIGSVAAATAASGTSLGGILIISGSNEQGATAPTAVLPELTANYNYTGINRTPIRFTKTAAWVKWYSGDIVSEARRDSGVTHKREIEQTLFDGVRSYTAGASAPRTTTGGIQEYLSTNSTNAGGTFDKGELADYLRTGLQYGNANRKVWFVAPIVSQVCSEFLQDNWVHARPDDNIFGVKVDYVISGIYGAKIPVFVKREWAVFGEGTSNHIGSRGLLVDLGEIRLKKAPDVDHGRWMTLLPKRAANDADELLEEWFSEFTVCIPQEKHLARLLGVTG